MHGFSQCCDCFVTPNTCEQLVEGTDQIVVNEVDIHYGPRHCVGIRTVDELWVDVQQSLRVWEHEKLLTDESTIIDRPLTDNCLAVKGVWGLGFGVWGLGFGRSEEH